MSSTFTFVVVLVTICLVYQLIRSYIENKNKQPDIDEELQDTLAKIDRLEERIKVLERIVTESRFDLKKEIDSL